MEFLVQSGKEDHNLAALKQSLC